jgi:ParB/RepB/Spo0J family partition protein
MNDTSLITLDQIAANPYQVREVEDPVAVTELAANIEKNGLLQPPTVRLVEDTGQPDWRGYEIAFGHTRLAAFRLLTSQGKSEFNNIPCFIRELDDLQMFEMAVAENIKRRDLNPIERAKAMHTYMEKFNKTSMETGEFFNCDESTVRGSVRLLGLPEQAQEKVSTGEISVGNARKLLTLQRLAPDEVDEVIEKLPNSIDPEKTIGDALQDSAVVLPMQAGYLSRESEPRAGDGLWPLSTPASAFTRLPELKAADAAKALGGEFTPGQFVDLGSWISELKSPLGDAAIPQLIKGGAPQDAIETLAHLIHPPACAACPYMARSSSNYYCGMKACHARKKASWIATQLERASRKLKIAVYDPKQDGKDYLSIDSEWNDKEKKLFADRDPDLRLMAGPRTYEHSFTKDLVARLILVGERAKKQKEEEKAERQSPPADRNKEYEHQRKLEQKREQKINKFVWFEAAPVFALLLKEVAGLAFLETLDKHFFSYEADPLEEPNEKASRPVKLDYARRVILFRMLASEIEDESFEERDAPVTAVAEHLKGVAKTWGVTLPKDWLKKAAEEDAVSGETKE